MAGTLRDLLRRASLVTEVELEHACREAAANDQLLLRVLHRHHLLDEEAVARILGAQLNLNLVDLDKRQLDDRALEHIPGFIAVRHQVLPLGLRQTASGDVLYLAMSDPTDAQAVEAVRRATPLDIIPLVAAFSGLEQAILRAYPPESRRAPAMASDFAAMPTSAPVVVGEIVDERAASPFGARGVDLSAPDPGEMEEWLTVSTQEVLNVYAPTAARSTGAATDDDLAWLREQAQASGNTDSRNAATAAKAAAPPEASAPRTPLPVEGLINDDGRSASAPLAPGLAASPTDAFAERSSPRTSTPAPSAGNRLPPPPTTDPGPKARVVIGGNAGKVGPTAVVCDDPAYREWTRAVLSGEVAELSEHASLDDLAGLFRRSLVENVLLIYPTPDERLVAALREAKKRPAPPRVFAVSPLAMLDAFEVFDVRIDPSDGATLAARLLDALRASAPSRPRVMPL